MNISDVRVALTEVITGFIVCVKTHPLAMFLNAQALILLSLAATHYCSSDKTYQTY